VYAQHHPSERKRRLEDGRLEYRVDVGALDEIARWIVGFGGTARVIAPDELVERVREIAAGAASVHTRITRAAAMTKRRRRPLTDSDTT
jgi:predicted DNA-binding transcriptional regulator YafY